MKTKFLRCKELINNEYVTSFVKNAEDYYDNKNYISAIKSIQDACKVFLEIYSDDSKVQYIVLDECLKELLKEFSQTKQTITQETGYKTSNYKENDNMKNKFKIVVNCEQNDPVDIKCGGPLYLGYDFFVLESEVEEMVEFIKEKLKENKQPLESIRYGKTELNAKLWSKIEIENCIKDGYN